MGYRKFSGEFCIGNGEFYNLRHLLNSLVECFYTELIIFIIYLLVYFVHSEAIESHF